MGLGATVAVLAAGTGIVVAAWPSTGPASGSAAGLSGGPPGRHPHRPAVQATLGSLDSGPSSGTAVSLEVPERTTEPFSLVGISWPDPKAAPHGSIEVRIRSIATGKWSGWRVLPVGEPTSGDGPGHAPRGATKPLWVGPCDGVAARIVASAGARPVPLPTGLRLDLISPGRLDRGGRSGAEPRPGRSGHTPSTHAGAG
jgi:hypothetical protein